MPARKALISITSASATLFAGEHTTGLFISEALHTYKVLVAAAFEPDFLNGEDLEVWNNVNSDFRVKLDSMTPTAELDASKYGLFYASAGHAALIDYPTASGLQKIAEQVWASGGVFASVCHGPAIFANVKDIVTGEPIIKGRKLTGFTAQAESTMGIAEELKALDTELVEDLAKRLGATYERSTGIWDDFRIVDDQLVTGQNPASATSTAKAAVEVFETL